MVVARRRSVEVAHQLVADHQAEAEAAEAGKAVPQAVLIYLLPRSNSPNWRHWIPRLLCMDSPIEASADSSPAARELAVESGETIGTMEVRVVSAVWAQ